MDQEISSFIADESLVIEESTILCIEVLGNKFGCCLLEGSSGTLKILIQDHLLSISKNDETSMIAESLILVNNPQVCLVSVRLEETSYNHIERICSNNDCKLEIQANDSFNRANEMELLSVEGHRGFVFLKNLMVNSNDSTCVTTSTINCLLSWLNKNYENGFEDDSSTTLSPRSNEMVQRIESLDLMDRAFIDEDSLFSLNVLPQIQKMGHDKLAQNACFSVWELLGRDLSEMGKKKLRTWITGPLTNKEMIVKRYDTIRTLLDRSNVSLFEDLRMAARRMPNVISIMNQLQRGKATVNSWRSLAEFLKRGLQVYRLVAMLQFDRSNQSVFTRIQRTVNSKIVKKLSVKINEVIDLETSKEIKSIAIRDGVDSRLDNCRNVYNRLETILCKVARDAEITILNSLVEQGIDTDAIDESLVNAVYIPQLGYMVTLEIEFGEAERIAQDLQWDEIFRTETNLYYKNQRVDELDNQFGDIHTLIFDLEIDVLHSFQNHVLEQREMLCLYGNLLAELEVLISFAHVSESRNYVEPEISENECILEVEEGRHALYETMVDTYIPNSITLNGGQFYSSDSRAWFENRFERIAILTGANQSGKSVFLTQNGLIVILAQIGCFVPAKRAKIGIVDKILSRVQTRETMVKDQSSFALDSLQMAKCLSLATERSLILVDEFGKGTDIADGPALFGSIIGVLSKDRKCPRIIGCTHFHELFKGGILSEDSLGVKHYTTTILLVNQVSQTLTIDVHKENFGITFLYSVQEGIFRESFGIYCAKVCGIDRSIVTRANELASLMNQGYDMVDYCGRLTEDEIVDLQRKQEIVKRFLLWNLDLEATTEKLALKDKLRSVINPS
ncbi:hypothetical protein ZYGR_0AS04900 [Zygosaccharomyces rouxii]|uniref:DNA mismatch repair proteins mutS family domain-containing protein n=1 Tax=Zygosaccharomyces rouxii TaxID=4956 RepID=A0A1Q3AHD9_ZYGRO|nr:hypothetical protein ZYGR_0AS04900 [Zygosaccharomyces rouxii]